MQLDDLEDVEVVVAELKNHELGAVCRKESGLLGEEEELERVDGIFERVEGESGEDRELAMDDRMHRDERPQLVLAFETGLSADGCDFAFLVQSETAERDAVIDDCSAEATERVLVDPYAEQLMRAHVVAVDNFVLAVLAEDVDELLEDHQDIVGDQLRAWVKPGYSWIR